jgi:hypothetical protein
MCGGNQARDRAVESQTSLSNTLSGIARGREAYQGPYLQSRVQGGLPFLPQLLDFQGGTLARQFAPARASLNRRLAGAGDTLPSGFRESALQGFEANRARGFDDSIVRALLLDEETRARAAGLANPLGYASAAQQGLGSILGMQQQPSALGGILGGVASGLVGLI